ncbi:MAG: NAD(P)/FAD-dependent oxidoreductase [Syntrophomonadaceae bacterium]|nr:NAD(P)/FAD-dependent oxidoreductase [Syntrophomonadaceae bacterium]
MDVNGGEAVPEVIVVGAGAAGLAAAGAAAEAGTEVLLLERNKEAGKKLRITGKGRCNLTTAVEPEELMKGYPGNGRFLYSAFDRFNNHDAMRFFTELGLELKTERGQRVFPVSDDAGEVVKVLKRHALACGAKLLTGERVEGLMIENGRVAGIKSDKGTHAATAVIICTGGKSYPGTGSTGDGYVLAQAAGHTIVKPRPGLVPLVVAEDWVRDLQGLSLKNVRAASYDRQGKKINEDFGELLFTHFGLSGPIILSMSRDIVDSLAQGAVRILLDLKPALSQEKLDERLQRDFKEFARRRYKNSLNALLPKKMIPVMVQLSGIDPDKLCHDITRAERQALGALLKRLTLHVTAPRGISEAIVTAGGVSVKELDPRTMQSKIVPGLYFAGEVIDVDGYTGGYNLQAAWSTGRLAGISAARRG